MKKVIYTLLCIGLFVPMIANAALAVKTPCDNPTRDSEGNSVKTCYLDIEVSGNSTLQTATGKFTLTNTRFKTNPEAGDSRIKAVNNGNNSYTFVANSPISNETVRVAKFTVYNATNGQKCSVIWTPLDYKNHYCENQGDTYYGLNGNVVSKEEYNKQCVKHSCEIVDGTYYDKNNNVVSESEYNKQCKTHTCEIIDGTYFGKNSTAVSKTEYDKQCTNPVCKIIDGTYYDKNSNVVSAAEYDKQCNVHYCKVVNGTYFGKNGNEVSQEQWDTECTVTSPDTGSFFSMSTALIGLTLVSAIAIVTKKINKVKKI